MALRIVALLPHEGWAYIAGDDAWWIARPPYEPSSLVPIPETVALSVLTRPGTIIPDRDQNEFATLEAIFGNLRDRAARAAADILSESDDLAAEIAALRALRPRDRADIAHVLRSRADSKAHSALQALATLDRDHPPSTATVHQLRLPPGRKAIGSLESELAFAAARLRRKATR